MATHNDLGRLGESLAVGYLLENNYVILERNWRFHKGRNRHHCKKRGSNYYC